LDANPTIAIKRDAGWTARHRAMEVENGWSAIFTHPRYEKKVAEHLTRHDVEAYLPTYTSKRRWRNRQHKSLELPLFPGYVFARVETRQRSQVLSTPGVLTILGDRRGSDLLPDRYIEALRTGLKLSRILPHPQAVVGARVRIVAGPLAGIEGVLTEVRSRLRLVLTLGMIQQSVSVEVSRNEIEPAGPQAGCVVVA